MLWLHGAGEVSLGPSKWLSHAQVSRARLSALTGQVEAPTLPGALREIEK